MPVGQSCTAAGIAVQSVDVSQLAVDPAGRLLFIGAVTNGGTCPVPAGTHHVLRREADGSLSSLAGGLDAIEAGTAAGAQLLNARGLVVDSAGNVYVSETGSTARRVRRLSAFGALSMVGGVTGVAATATTRGDGGPATAARCALPGFLAFTCGGDLVLTDSGLNDVRLIRAVARAMPPSATVTVLGDGQCAPVGRALPQPVGVVVVDDEGAPVPSVRVTVTAPPGVSVEPASGLTDGNGAFSAAVFLGRTPGPVTLTFAVIASDGWGAGRRAHPHGDGHAAAVGHAGHPREPTRHHRRGAVDGRGAHALAAVGEPRRRRHRPRR